MTDKPTLTEVAEALAAAFNGSSPAIICYAMCVPCQFGQCQFTPHRWAGPDDIEHAAATGQPEPVGNCTCDCARPPEPTP